MDGEEYLEPGFDASSLTVPRLRSILLAHNVNYPSSAKKSQLVDMFNEHVASQAKKIKSASLRVKRSSRGIENVPSASATSSAQSEEYEEEPPATVTRGSRRSTRARTEEAEDVQPTPRRMRHSTAPPEATPRRPSSKHARQVEKVEEEAEEEPEPKRPASRKSRMSAATPGSRREERDDTSPFSNQNVFQSGGSPPPPTTTDRRRTTNITSDEAKRRRSRDARRRTEEVRPARQQMDGAVVPTRRTFEMPVSRVKREQVEANEEFTPEEEQDLVQAEQAGEVVPARRKTRRPASGAPANALVSVLVVLLSGFAFLWGQEKYEVGYCGVGRPSLKIAGVEIPEWADALRPECEPCPAHAMCNERFETVCESGFVLTQHPLSLGGFVPIPPTCEPDSTRARKVNAVKTRAVEELREQNARYECGDANTPDVQEIELKQAISSQRRKSMSNEEFEDIWASALGEVLNEDEVATGGGGSLLRSASLARLPLACAIRRSLRETLRAYFWSLVILFAALSGSLYTRHRITSGRETESRAKQLATLTLEKLSLQASLHASDPGAWREDYVSVAQLRDDVLREEFSATRRGKLWAKVQRKVEGNANVRAVVRESRSGDVGRTWQWVGAVGRLESPDDARRKSGRVSFGGERWVEGERSERSEGEVSRWREGGAYY